jgi:hypothetical protein
MSERLITVGRMDGDITDLGPAENIERNINSGISQGPYLTVKISESAHCFPIHCKDEIFRL